MVNGLPNRFEVNIMKKAVIDDGIHFLEIHCIQLRMFNKGRSRDAIVESRSWLAQKRNKIK